jgi:hypothetical protein
MQLLQYDEEAVKLIATTDWKRSTQINTILAPHTLWTIGFKQDKKDDIEIVSPIAAATALFLAGDLTCNWTNDKIKIASKNITHSAHRGALANFLRNSEGRESTYEVGKTLIRSVLRYLSALPSEDCPPPQFTEPSMTLDVDCIENIDISSKQVIIFETATDGKKSIYAAKSKSAATNQKSKPMFTIAQIDEWINDNRRCIATHQSEDFIKYFITRKPKLEKLVTHAIRQVTDILWKSKNNNTPNKSNSATNNNEVLTDLVTKITVVTHSMRNHMTQ